jgi:hypothetical protein
MTAELATLQPPPPEMQQLLGAMAGNQQAMDGFARVNAGVESPRPSSPRRTSGGSWLGRTNGRCPASAT